MNKKDVRIVSPLALNFMVKHDYINSVSVANNVSKHSFGKRHIIESIADNTGLCYGSPKATTYVSCAPCRDTATSNLNKSRIIGSTNRLRMSMTIKISNMSFMTPRTSIKMAALLI